MSVMLFFFFSSRRRHTRWPRDWSSDVCSSDLEGRMPASVRWSASIGSGSGFGFIPYVQGQDVYTASASGQVSRVDLSTGRVKWATQVNKRLSAGEGTGGRVVAGAAPAGTATALGARGKE